MEYSICEERAQTQRRSLICPCPAVFYFGSCKSLLYEVVMPANPDRCFVVAVSGPSGAGKSTAIRNLVERLGDAVALYLDDYEASSIYPNIEQWLADGA